MGYSKQDFEGTTSFLTGNELVLHDQSETAHPSLLALLKKHLEDELAKSAEIKDNKNIAGGYAGLDANGKIPYGLINTITTSLLGKGAVTREKLAAELIEELEGFVVKENGKGLSEVNYTKDRDEAVQKIAGILSDIYHLKQNSASSNALNKHVSDGTVHMTAAEREVFIKTAEGLVEECEKFAKAAAEEAERLANIVKQGNGENSVVFNDYENNSATGDYTHAEGYEVKAEGFAVHAEGRETIASGDYSHAEGHSTKTTGYASHAEGGHTEAGGEFSHAEGRFTIAQGSHTHVEGYKTTAQGMMSHAEGADTSASAKYSHSEGYKTSANGAASHSEGQETSATGINSHAEGRGTVASGQYSHAEGVECQAIADRSHAEGMTTIASGNSAHSEGYQTEAKGTASHAEGYYTKAYGKQQHVEGKFNIPDAANKYAHIVGNGTADDSRSNAHTLDWEGNAWFKGDVYVGGENAESGERLVKFSEADDLDKRTKQLQYYGDANIEPSDESLFTFTLNNGGSSYSISLKKPSERDLATAEIVIPYEHDGLPVREIADDGFASAKSYFRALDRIIIPSSIRVIGISAFYNNPNITYAIEIPDSVRQIGDFAFDRCFIPSELEIPDGVKVIEAGTFMATTITSVVLPKALTDISDSAFDACVTLKDVYYKGSSSQWEQISIGDNNYYLLNEANIHFGYVEDGYYATAEEVKKTSAESANAITKTVRGLSSISVYDVSPARHKIKLQLMRYNLLNINTMLNDNLTAEASEGETYNLRTGTDSDTPSYLSEKIELNIPANRAIRMCMGGIAFVAGSNYTGEDNKASLIGIFTLSDGTEVKEKFIDGRSLTFDKDITHIQLYAYSFYAIPVTDEVSVSTYAPSGIYDTTPSMCRFTQLMICYDYDDVSYEYFPYDTAYGESMHIVVTDSNNEEITYTADAGGYAEIESIYPIMKIGVDVSALLECEYNQDINAVIAALESKIAELQGS